MQCADQVGGSAESWMTQQRMPAGTLADGRYCTLGLAKRRGRARLVAAAGVPHIRRMEAESR